MSGKVYIRRRKFMGQTWYQINDTDVFVDQKMLERIKECNEIIDQDVLQLERDRQALWN